MMLDRGKPMLKTKYDVLTRNGKEEFVVVPVKDYEALIEKLEDQADYRALVEARRANAGKPTYTLEQVKRELGMKRPGRKRKA
jgi:PHD/YefM family antitoxin component YafN of YafNO toxin-antitoxin module